jgi:hypothetical protein
VVAAAVCPHPPLLVPQIASGAAAELDPLRSACDRAVAALLAATPETIVAIGSGPHPSGAELSRPDLPLSLAVAEWLLDRAGAAVPRDDLSVSPSATADQCRGLGGQLAGRSDRVALLVMGDGSACHGLKAPGYDDERADGFDAEVAAALARADAPDLLGLDPELAGQLRCAGRGPWQVLAGAVIADGRGWHGRLTYHDIPYGVAYYVAEWHPGGRS